jgi:hypothetical protein
VIKLKTNEKLKKDGITHWSLPSLVTCPGANPKDENSPCSVCYDVRLAKFRPGVKVSRMSNLALAKSPEFVDLLDAAVKRDPAKVHRLHTGGDFFNLEYRNKIFEVCVRNPSKTFYAYTKSANLFIYADGSGEISRPKNLRIIYSLGGKFDFLVNTKTMRHAKVFESQAAIKRARYKDASVHDIVAATTRSLKVGLVWH